MPREIRQIILSDEELRQSIQSYRRMQDSFLPQGEVLRTTVVQSKNGDRHLSVAVNMRYGASEHEVDVQVEPADLLAMLIRFCLENNIPVPRRGEKTVSFVNNEAVLHIQSATDVAAGL